MTKKLSDYERGQQDMRDRASKLCYEMDSESTCSACNGSGYYDHNGSPKCGCCNGKGVTESTPNDAGYAISKLEIMEEIEV